MFSKFFSDQLVKSHCYSIYRCSLFSSKKLLRIQEELDFVDDQIAENANQEVHEEAHEEAYEKAHEEAYEEDNKKANDNAKETDELQGSSEEQEDIEQAQSFLNIPSDDFKMKFERSFNKMKAEEKWYLSNGKCVEDELFAFGMQCKEEHPCHSFIVDVNDTNYQKYGVFNDDELQEIESFQEKKLPIMPIQLRDYLNKYNLTTTAALRQQIFTLVPLNENYYQDMDWIRFTVYSFVREYESNNFKRPHNEEWYKAHVWHFLDTVFNSESEIEVLR
jgi:hypothetical protein